MEPSLALQTVVRERLLASPELLTLVPGYAILDTHSRPELERKIIIGEGQTLFGDSYNSFHERCYLTLHIWVRADDFTVAKQIADAVRKALRNTPWIVGGNRVHGISLNSRFIRDPGGEFAHGVITVDATMQELAA